MKPKQTQEDGCTANLGNRDLLAVNVFGSVLPTDSCVGKFTSCMWSCTPTDHTCAEVIVNPDSPHPTSEHEAAKLMARPRQMDCSRRKVDELVFVAAQGLHLGAIGIAHIGEVPSDHESHRHEPTRHWVGLVGRGALQCQLYKRTILS